MDDLIYDACDGCGKAIAVPLFRGQKTRVLCPCGHPCDYKLKASGDGTTGAGS